MAIDSRFKRFNMIEFGGIDIVLPEADGAIDADDRAHLLGLYGGNALSPVVAVALKFYEGLRRNVGKMMR